MDLFKTQLDRIQRQLGGLSASQKMLTMSLVAIMIMTLIWWGRYAGEPETEQLFSHTLSPDEMTRIGDALDRGQVKYTNAGDKLMVASGDKLHAYSVLAYANALPRGGKDSFDDIVKGINPFQAESTTEKLWVRAREVALGQIIQRFPGVVDAQVMIDATHEVRIGGGEEPRASVTITTQPGTAQLQPLVDAAASLVEGAQTGLAMSRIRVVVNGRPMRVKDSNSDDTTVGDALDRAHAEEVKVEDKIKDLYSNISGLLVKVTFSVNITKSEQKKVTYDTKNSMSKETESHSSTEQNTSPANSAAEAGAVSNATVDISGAAKPGAGPVNSRDQTDTKYQNFPASIETVSQTPAGDTTPVGATVRFPRDYFVSAYKRVNADVGTVTNAVLQDYIDKELARFKSQVTKITLLKDSDVVVADYVDVTPPVAVAAAAPTILSATLSPHRIKEVALAVMALISLFMVSAVVKKGTPAPAPFATLTPAGGDGGMLEASEGPMGEVGASTASLEGMEMDEEAIRAQQVVQQVTSLVKENPDSAASLVKRWLSRA